MATMLLVVSGIVSALTTLGVVATLLLKHYSIERAASMFIMGGILTAALLSMVSK